MTRGVKSRRSPNNLQLAQQHCEALIIGPARDSAVEKTLAVFLAVASPTIHQRRS
jgi:predicted dinucleotide-binding enzyme